MDPLRVAGPSLYGLRAGSTVGGERYERALLTHLPDHGISVRLGLPRTSPFCPPRRAGTEAVPHGWLVDALAHDESLHWVRAPGTFVPYVSGLLARAEADVLRGGSVRHAGPSLLIANARAARGARRPVVLHHHHLFPRWARLEAAVCRRADAVITVSEHSKRALVARGVDGRRVHVVPQGIDRPPPTGGTPERWPTVANWSPAAAGRPPDVADRPLRLLALGRLEARKRPELAIDTVAQLAARGVPATLVVAGDGDPARVAALRARAADQGVAERVAFLGGVEDELKWRLYDSADVLLFGSQLEGFGLVVAEAQSRGVPVIAAAGAATAEALAPGESGFLLDPDPNAFADAAVRLAEDPDLRARMSDRAVRFSGRFDSGRAAEAVATIYRFVASRFVADP